MTLELMIELMNNHIFIVLHQKWRFKVKVSINTIGFIISKKILM